MHRPNQVRLRARGLPLAAAIALLAAVSVLVFATARCTATGSEEAASRGTGVYVAANGDDSNPCTKDAPCATSDRAYRVAKPGQTVEVAGGRYPAQEIGYDANKTSPDDVVFRPAAGANVTLSDLSTGDAKTGVAAKHFEVRDMEVAGWVAIKRGAEDVTLRDLDMRFFNIYSARDIKILGGDVGPGVDGINQIKDCGEPGCFPATDILIDGVTFHDVGVSEEWRHSECLAVWAARKLVIRNSRFERCKDFDILAKPTLTTSPIRGITLENNFFDVPVALQDMPYSVPLSGERGGYAVMLSPAGVGMSDVVIRYNSALAAILPRTDTTPTMTDVVFTGNIVPEVSPWTCGNWRHAAFVVSHNLYESGAPCGPTDRVGDPAYRNRARVDLRLSPGSDAIGAGNPGDFPATDIEGESRSVGDRTPDAGADEAG